jgi:hypothetical protein
MKIKCNFCGRKNNKSPSHVREHNFCNRRCYWAWMKEHSSFALNNPNKGRVFTLKERKRFAYWKGKNRRIESRINLSRTVNKLISKGKVNFLSGLKNVNVKKRRRCVWENCGNFIFGERNYCNEHWLLSPEGIAENRARASFHYATKASWSNVNSDVKKVLVLTERLKESLRDEYK